MKKFTAFLVLTVLTLPIAFANGTLETEIGIKSETPKVLNIGTTITSVTGWLLGLLIAIALLFVVYAAFLYLLGGSDSGSIDKAKNILVYAAVAIALGLGAKVLETIVRGLLTIT